MGRYEVSRQGDRICFKVLPTSAPFPLGCGLACVAIFFLLVMVASFTNDNKEGFQAALFMFAVFLGLPLLVLLFLWKGPRANAYRKETSFEVTPTGIAIYGGEITRGRIHRLILRNHVSGAEHIYVESTVFWGGNLASNLALAAPALGASVRNVAGALARMHRSALARQSWRLDVDAQGQAYPLAGGLDETTAYGLMTDVQRALTGETPPATGETPLATAAPSSPGGFCTNCRHPRSAGASFCTECGSQHASATGI